jgi:palmitoyltransferase
MLKVLRILPVLTLIFTVLVFCLTVYIDNTFSSFVIFTFMSLQVYVNWIAIYLTSYTDANRQESGITKDMKQKNNSVVLDLNPAASYATYGQNHDYSRRCDSINKSNMNQDVSLQNVDIRKIWYCSKCLTNTPFNCHHCPLCDRCIIHRDHHCFFLGTCICLQNMGHFIVLCLYAGLGSMCVNIRLFPVLYEHFENKEDSISLWKLSSCYFFPVALGRWLSGQEDILFLLLIVLFDLLVSASICTFGFSVYRFYLALVGQGHVQMKGTKERHKSFSEVSLRNLRNNFTATFGKWGAVNFVFPIVLLQKIQHLKYFRRESKYR